MGTDNWQTPDADAAEQAAELRDADVQDEEASTGGKAPPLDAAAEGDALDQAQEVREDEDYRDD